MALKLTITQEEYEALSEGFKEAYVTDGDNYKLDVSGLEDTGALKRAKDYEKEQRKAAEKRSRELSDEMKGLQDQLDELKNDGSRKKGDVEALERSYQDKIAKQKEESDAAQAKLNRIIEKQTLEAKANQIATKLCGENSDIILPHIKSRMKVEITDDEAHVRVLNDQGEVTADSLDDLQNSFFTSDRFAPIVIGSKASGSGAAGRKGSGAAGKPNLKDMSATEEAKFANEHPEQYQEMVAASEGA